MVVAEIITYNPDIPRLRENILSIANQVQKLILVDNKSDNITEIERLAAAINPVGIHKPLTIFKNKSNNGIAHAINQGLAYARNNGFEWLLLLDQDSVAAKNMIEEILKVKQLIPDDKVAIFSAVPVLENIADGGCRARDFDCPTGVITSGSLINVQIYTKLKGAECKLFIDSVDVDMCLKARHNGYSIVRCTKAFLYHRLGEVITKKIMGIEIPYTHYNKVRKYYIARNYIYIYRNYGKEFSDYIKTAVMRRVFFETVLKGFLFEPYRFVHLYYSLKGFWHGLNSKYGKLK